MIEGGFRIAASGNLRPGQNPRIGGASDRAKEPLLHAAVGRVKQAEKAIEAVVSTQSGPARCPLVPQETRRQLEPLHTRRMKTAVSIPDDVFAEAEKLARRLKKSRSALYSHALREFVSRHSGDVVTEALNKVYADPSNKDDGFATAAGRRRLRRVEW